METIITEDSSNELIQLVSFKIGEEEFAVDILKVQEINRMLEITKVPNAPFYVEGVINLRGLIIPVVDLRKKFGLPELDNTLRACIIVVLINISGRVIQMVLGRIFSL